MVLTKLDEILGVDLLDTECTDAEGTFFGVDTSGQYSPTDTALADDRRRRQRT